MPSSSPTVKGPAWARSPFVTTPFLGVNIVWSTEMAFASPYLLSLGLSRAVMALVFLAGPLSGLVVQPIIGHIADKSTNRFGRRRPFMIGGCIASALGMLLLGFTREFASIFVPNPSPANDLLTASLAVLALYIVDFTINAVMAVDRALLVDVLREDEQQDGNAWSSRMAATGSLVGFFVGQADLPRYLPALGKTQLQVLSVITGVVLLAAHLIATFTVNEIPLEKKGSNKISKANLSWYQSLATWCRTMFASLTNLPKGMMSICIIQFVSMLGWFPVMFFTTTWIGDIYRSQYPDSLGDGSNTGGSEATRAGTLALFYSAIVSLATSNLLPLFVLQPDSKSGGRSGAVVSWAQGLTKKLPFRLDLATTWAIGHFVFGVLMWSTWFVTTVRGATWIFALSGFSGTCGHWAPWSLLGEIILSDGPTQTNEISHNIHDHSSSRAPLLAGAEEFDAENGSQDDDDDDAYKAEESSTYPPMKNELVDQGNSRTQDRAGVLLSILNIFIVLPQFVIIALSSVIFAIFEPGRAVFHQPTQPVEGTAATPSHNGGDVPHTDAIGLLFRIGGTSAFVACYLTFRLARELRRQQAIRALP